MANILTENQQKIIELVVKNKNIQPNFYLTGGTALAEYYFQHRVSDDLDFFSENEIDPIPLNIFFKEIKNEIGFTKIDYRLHQNRNLYYFHFNDKVLKTEFTYFPFPRIEKGKREYGVELDSILDIAVNKLFTIYQRSVARDYIDLYYLCKEKGYLINDLIALAKAKFDWHIDPLQLGSQFTKAYDVIDYPIMSHETDHKQWKNFFIEEAIKFKKDIFS